MTSSVSVYRPHTNEPSDTDDEWTEVVKVSDSPASEEDIADSSLIGEERYVGMNEQDVGLPNEAEPSSSSQNPSASPIRNNSFALESAEETIMRLANEFPRVVEPHADTLFYLGVPPKAAHETQDEYDYIKQQFEPPYLMHSSTLRRIGSAKFDNFLGPTSARTERRLKKLGIHKYVQEPNTIKYYIDMSPVLNDDEALIQVTELTVPRGALQWHQRARDLGIAPSMICGRDNLNVPPRLYDLLLRADPAVRPKKEDEQPEEPKKTLWTASRTGQTQGANADQNAKAVSSMFDLESEEEYNPLRHHTAVARLLQALAGNDPKLDSAAKVWTFTMLAKYFDCAHYDRVNHWIVSWLLKGGNSHFIQRLPDVSYRLALATQSQWLMRCTFAILVGRQAIINGLNHLEPSSDGRRHHRHVAEHLDDDEINRIDHAAAALTSRVKNTLDELVVFPGLWTVGDYPESKKFQSFESSGGPLYERWSRVRKLLQNYIRRMIYMTLSHQYDLSSSNDIPAFSPFSEFKTYTDVPRPLRFLTEQFWHILRNENFARDYSDTKANHTIWDTTQESLRAEGIIKDPYIPYISRQELYAAIEDLNQCNLMEDFDESLTINSPKKKARLSIDLKQKSRAADWEPSARQAEAEHSLSRSDTLTQDEAQPTEAADPYAAKEPQELTAKELRLAIRLASFRAPARPSTPEALDPNRNMSFDTTGTVPGPFAQEESLTTDAAERIAHVVSVSPQSTKMTSFREVFDPPSLPPHVSAQKPYYEDTPPPQPESTLDSILDDALSSELKIGYANTKRASWNSSDDCWNDDTNDLAENLTSGNSKPFSLPTSSTSKRSAWASLADPLVDNTQAFSDTTITRSLKPRIEPITLLQDLQSDLRNSLKPLVEAGYVADGTCDFDIPINEVNTLVCLTEDEWKYLPLWAGGFDDGTGGVFNDGVEPPDAPAVEEGGFRGGAMGIIPGVGSSMGGSMAGSEFEDVATEVGISTVGKASHHATDGTATETVMSLDE